MFPTPVKHTVRLFSQFHGHHVLVTQYSRKAWWLVRGKTGFRVLSIPSAESSDTDIFGLFVFRMSDI